MKKEKGKCKLIFHHSFGQYDEILRDLAIVKMQATIWIALSSKYTDISVSTTMTML